MDTRLRFVAGMMVLLVASFSSPAHAQDPSRRIEGSWFVQLTMRNCADDSVVGSGFGLNTFAPGGVMLGTPSAPTAAIRTGHGLWTYSGGSLFVNRLALFTYNPQTGALAGVQFVTRNIEVGPGPDEFRARDTAQLYDPVTLAPIGPPTCVTGAGRRVP